MKTKSKEILLTIVIPTFNRPKSLTRLLKSINKKIDIGEKRLEVIVIDNCSSHKIDKRKIRSGIPLKIKVNLYNLGIEGNIVESLITTQSSFVWLLSDHQILFKRITPLLDFLENERPDFVHCGIDQYSLPLQDTYKVIAQNKLTKEELTDMIFYAGNISTFLVSRELINKYARDLFRFSIFAYPHIAVFKNSSNLNFAQTDKISKFCELPSSEPASSYNRFKARFIGMPLAIMELNHPNIKIKYMSQGMKKSYRRAAIGDGLRILCFDDVLRNSLKRMDYLKCAMINNYHVRCFFILVFILHLLPAPLRRTICKFVFYILNREEYIRMKTSNAKIVSGLEMP